MKKAFNTLMSILLIAGVLCLIAAIVLIVKAIQTQISSWYPFTLLLAAFVFIILGSIQKK